LVVVETQDFYAASLDETLAIRIVFLPFVGTVRRPVKLDTQTLFRAVEIKNVMPDSVLTAKFKSSYLPVP